VRARESHEVVELLTKHEVEQQRRTVARQGVQTLESVRDSQPPQVPIHVLHLSDLHFDKSTSVNARLQWLLDYLKLDTGLGIGSLDYLVISGDFTDKACVEGFENGESPASTGLRFTWRRTRLGRATAGRRKSAEPPNATTVTCSSNSECSGSRQRR